MKFSLSLVLALILMNSCSESDDSITIPISGHAPDGHYLQAPGKSANELLSAEEYNGLSIQVAYVAGYEPENTSITQLTAFLNSRINKPAGISLKMLEVPSLKEGAYSLDDIRQIEYESRTLFTQDSILSLFIFIADNSFAQNKKVLGMAYQNTSVVLFGETIHQLSGGIAQPSRELLEATILNHEIGHLMGLVNNGTTPLTNHQDTANGHHCSVESCLMNWSVETENVIANLLGQSFPPNLDSQCIADLKSNDGR